ncbi:MAG: type IV pilin protein [Halieaceae bacterium]|jgi:type IV pilus assembly protein PilE|nr:type IV pilin protein [Halieaceae bacterium]
MRASDGPGARGFTLIELIIVIVIVSVLAAIALPAYQDSMRKGRRADAKSGLMDAANRQERFMLDRSAYTRDMKNLGFGDDPMISEEGFYSIDVDETATAALCGYAFDPNDNAPPCYVLTATPVASEAQVDDLRCTKFILNSSGARAAEGSAASECW